MLVLALFDYIEKALHFRLGTNSTADRYCKLVYQTGMTSLVLSQVAAVRELAGMSCIVPVPALLSLLSVDKLESLVCVDMSSTHEDMHDQDR